MKAIKLIQSRFQANNTKTLDVGCFNGFFVKKLLSLGYDAQGIDFNKSAVAFRQKNLGLGSRISTQTINEMIKQGESFDLVNAF